LPSNWSRSEPGALGDLRQADQRIGLDALNPGPGAFDVAHRRGEGGAKRLCRPGKVEHDGAALEGDRGVVAAGVEEGGLEIFRLGIEATGDDGEFVRSHLLPSNDQIVLSNDLIVPSSDPVGWQSQRSTARRT